MTSRAGSATRCRTCATSVRLLSPLHYFAQDSSCPLRSWHDKVASIEQVLRRFGRPDADAHVRDVELTDVLEHRAVVFVIAETHDPARVFTRDQVSQLAALPRLRRVHLDDLAAEICRQPCAVERRPQQLEHLYAALVRVPEMNRGAGRLHLEPRARDRLEQPRGLGIEPVERLFLGGPRDYQPAVSDQTHPLH